MLAGFGSLMKRYRWWIVVASIVVFAAGTTVRALAVNGSIFYINSTSAPVIEGIQNGGGDGMEGIVGSTAGAIGILGFENNTSNGGIGLEGLVKGPTSTGLYGQDLNTNTGLPGVGLLGTSTSGVGMKGESLLSTGIGILGIDSVTGHQIAELGINGGPGVLAETASTTFMLPAVDGESTTPGFFDSAGTFGLNFFNGLSAAPAYGVVSYGNFDGVFGLATGDGSSNESNGLTGFDDRTLTTFPDSNTGVLGQSTWGAGMLATGGGVTATRIGGSTTWTYGLYVAGGNTGTGTSYAVGQELEVADASTDGFFAFSDVDSRNVIIMPTGTDMIDGFGPSGTFAFDGAGNLTISGLIFTAGACAAGCINEPNGQRTRVVTYAPHEAEPTSEDVGEGQLVGGRGYIRLDPAFANVIDQRANYFVFITPEGDNRGLYVTRKSHAGFEVRESQGGHSTLAFSYRIVAKPYASTATRLARVTLAAPARSPQGNVRRTHIPRVLSPEQQLVARLGYTAARQLIARERAAAIARARMIGKLPGVDAKGTLHLGSTMVRPPQH